jgi:hypothetical protein
MRTVTTLALMLMLAAASPLAQADAPKPEPLRTDRPVEAFGDTDTGCRGWTDGCRLCRKVGDDPVCTPVGIACTPGRVVCTARTTAP